MYFKMLTRDEWSLRFCISVNICEYCNGVLKKHISSHYGVIIINQWRSYEGLDSALHQGPQAQKKKLSAPVRVPSQRPLVCMYVCVYE